MKVEVPITNVYDIKVASKKNKEGDLITAIQIECYCPPGAMARIAHLQKNAPTVKAILYSEQMTFDYITDLLEPGGERKKTANPMRVIHDPVKTNDAGAVEIGEEELPALKEPELPVDEAGTPGFDVDPETGEVKAGGFVFRSSAEEFNAVESQAIEAKVEEIIQTAEDLAFGVDPGYPEADPVVVAKPKKNGKGKKADLEATAPIEEPEPEELPF